MDLMDGLAGTLAGMKEDAMVAAKMGAGVVLGASIAKFVTEKALTLGADEKGAGAWLEKAPWVAPLVPVAVGLFLFSKFRDQYPALAGANGLGMIGYGVGALVKQGLAANAASAEFAKNVGLGAVDTYESPFLAGLGYNDMSINRYLSPVGLRGLGDMRNPGAPVMIETVDGAPTQFQTLAAAPMTSTALSATLM